jgi:polyhydroxybutyrate depolymerase
MWRRWQFLEDDNRGLICAVNSESIHCSYHPARVTLGGPTMRVCIFSITIAFLTSAVTFGQGQVVKKTLMHENVERTYNLYVPSTYSAGDVTPLVLNMHGAGGNADQQMASSAMNAVAEEKGFLVAYPNAAVDGDWSISGDHNLSFIDSLLGAIDLEYSVDSSRTYSTGYSQGGMMSYRLASLRPNTFAAIASVAGIPPLPAVVSRPVPLMHVHGTADVVVPVDGTPSFNGSVYPLLDDFLNEWAVANGCDLTQTVSELPNISADDGSTVSVLSFDGCDTYTSINGDEIVASVVHYRIDGGGHSWPVLDADRTANLAALEETYGTDALPFFNPLNSDFYASAEIWNFFEQHELAVVPGDYDDDFDVDGNDFLAWQRGESPNVLSQADLDVWKANFGGGSLAAHSSAVPEPTTSALALAALCLAMSRRRV